MPFDISETINHISDFILASPLIYSVARNPIYTALFVVFVIIIIIIFVFRDADVDEPLIIMGLRSGFWIYLILLGILFVHNKVLSHEMQLDNNKSAYNGIFNDRYGNITNSSLVAEDVVPVQINTDFTKLSQ